MSHISDNEPAVLPYEKDALEINIENYAVDLAGALLELYYKTVVNNDYKQYVTLLIDQIQKVIVLFKGRLLSLSKTFKPDWSSSLLMWVQSMEIPIQNILSLLFETLEFVDAFQKEELINQLSQVGCMHLCTLLKPMNK